MQRRVAKLDIFDRGRKSTYLKFSIKQGVRKLNTQKFLYENYILSTKRKVRGSAAPSRPLIASHMTKYVLVWA
ncbi:hypothetical protein Hanom_Chr16g01443981 [Helianthus anomalus]